MADEGNEATFFDPLDSEIAKDNERATKHESGPGIAPRPSHKFRRKTKPGEFGSDANGTEEEARQFADWLDLKH